MDKIPWFFVYSEKYKVFYDILSNLISETYFDVYAIEKDQSLFDKDTYKENTHFFSGCFIKDDEIWNILHTVPDDSFFIFSDVDLVVFEEPLYNYIQQFLKEDNDIVFMKESEEIVNVGFMLIKNTKKVKELFCKVMKDHILNPNVLDQTVINNFLTTWDGKYKTFSTEYVYTNLTFELNVDKSKLCVYQPLCSASRNYKINILEKMVSIQHAFNLDLSNYIDELSKKLDTNSEKQMFHDILQIFSSN